MALWCLSVSAATAVFSPSPSSTVKIPNGAVAFGTRQSVLLPLRSRPFALRRRRRTSAVCMASLSAEEDDEEDKPSRNPLDFPYEWVRPKPPARPNVFPKFPAMTSPLPTWLPYDEAPDDEIDEDEEELEEQEQPERGPDE